MRESETLSEWYVDMAIAGFGSVPGAGCTIFALRSSCGRTASALLWALAVGVLCVCRPSSVADGSLLVSLCVQLLLPSTPSGYVWLAGWLRTV